MGSRPDLRQKQGEKKSDWLERVRQIQLAENPPKIKKQRKQRDNSPQSHRYADEISDDLGESPDY